LPDGPETGHCQPPGEILRGAGRAEAQVTANQMRSRQALASEPVTGLLANKCLAGQLPEVQPERLGKAGQRFRLAIDNLLEDDAEIEAEGSCSDPHLPGQTGDITRGRLASLQRQGKQWMDRRQRFPLLPGPMRTDESRRQYGGRGGAVQSGGGMRAWRLYGLRASGWLKSASGCPEGELSFRSRAS